MFHLWERARPKFRSEGAKAGAAVLGAVLVCRMREGSESEHTKASESRELAMARAPYGPHTVTH